MKITKIFNSYTASPSFKRAPDSSRKMPDGRNEEQFYSDTLKDAKKFLGITNLALILHQSSFPVKDNDLFIGSHIDNKAVEVNKFLKLHGFDSIQLGPPGLTRLSPYNSGVNSKSYLYTDMGKLTTADYAKILTTEDISSVINSIDKNRVYENISDQTRFNRAFYTHDKLFARAYDNLILKVKNKDKSALNLYKEFEEFKQKEQDWLESDALFDHFKKKFSMDENFFEWPEMNRNLMLYLNNPESPQHDDALDYVDKIHKKHGRELEIYKFEQFILDKQEREFIKENPEKLNYISDAIIGFSLADYWANQDAFLQDYRVGTPYGGEGRSIGGGTIWGENQTWDIPVLDPQKLFVKDDEGKIIGLGIAGKIIKNKFERLLDTYQNIRIDHVIGLIDPWIYNKNNVEIRHGRYPNEGNDKPEHIVYKNAHGANISLMGKEHAYNAATQHWDWYTTQEINREIANMPNVDPDGDYAKILDEILLPLFKEKGVKTDDIVWESLGCNTKKFDEVYKKKERPLPDISSSYQYQLQYRPKKDWMMIGSHDNGPFAQICTDDFYRGKAGLGNIMNGEYLVGNMYPELSNDERQKFIDNLGWDRRARVKLKYEELLRFGKKIQFTFMDFFGLDKTYNYSGTQNAENWKLRLKKDYQKDYYDKLTWKNGDKGVFNVPVNMPEHLRNAVKAKILTEGGQLEDHQKLLDDLEYCDKNILKEKE